eukprot:TRINITY_DN32_c0_g1_i2.p1 TRINITY_DN32_c0_g1~~TRINITY_DN32_c0_g1_i2.p1  ORF type:complete len:352 (-),score=55.31 TRINITY_DN32_c0_g1_i2:77-1048(-)
MRVRALLTTTTLFPSVSSAFKYNLGGRAHNTNTQRYLSTHRSLRMAQDAAAKGAEVVVALDFDGVLCNSVGESSRSAFLCLQKRYPDVLKGTEWENLEDSDAPAWLMDKMRKLRPVVETGYENILLTRLLLEEYRMAETSGKETGTRPLTVGEIAANWGEELKDTLMRKYGYTQDELVHAFGDTRDEWIARDEESWLEANSFYERLGVRDAARYSKANVYIITTKQTRFAEALLKHAGIEVPEDKESAKTSGWGLCTCTWLTGASTTLISGKEGKPIRALKSFHRSGSGRLCAHQFLLKPQHRSAVQSTALTMDHFTLSCCIC